MLIVDAKRRGGVLESIELADIRGIVKQSNALGDVYIAHEVSRDTRGMPCINVSPSTLAPRLGYLINELRKDVAPETVVDDGLVERALDLD